MERSVRLKRLYFRSSHRGSKETDIILAPYASAHLESMSDTELDEFESFLAENDTDIWDWVAGKSLPEDGRYATLIERLRKKYDVSG
jgi:antitoxin CptB